MRGRPTRLRSLGTRLSPRRSFAAKLLVALIGTVAVVLGVAFAAVRRETAVQVEAATLRAGAVADTTFRSIEQVQRARLAEVAGRVARGRRTVAALEAAVESGEAEALLADLTYDLVLSQVDPDAVLLALTDPDGRPVLARAQGRPLAGEDPAGVVALVDRMYEEGVAELRAYRIVDGHLYNVQATFLELGGRPVGVFALGLPLGDAEARTLGAVAGAEVCFVAGGACLAGTPAARGGLSATVVAAAARPGARDVQALGGRWSVSATPLDSADAAVGQRVTAVPLDGVLEPFDRIARTLALAGLAAVLLAVVLGGALARGLVRPVRALVAATDRVARGDYDAEVTAAGQDEIGALARSFNEMTLGLRLKERYRGVLDKVVSRDVAEELMRGEVELGGENRDVTVLFADVRGFTPLTQGMEPQRVIRLLNDCMAVLSAAVDAEGGIVDKYVGDEIMAVFGAPARQADHAERALRAALRMRSGIAALNEERARGGEPPLGVGVGVNTGEVVAGNMGSPDRLNYTVLGETVNLAARLCSAAAPGQILASRATVEASGGVRAEALGGRALKGFSEEVALFDVQALATPAAARSATGAGALVALLAIGAALGAPERALAQDEGGLPTLEELGLWWASPSGRYQAGLSGRLDLEAYVPGSDPSWLIPERDPFAAGRLRLFLDAFAGDAWYGVAELRVDRGETPRAGPLDVRLEQLFVRVRPLDLPLELQVGRFASAFGGYPARHHGVGDPFVRPPLTYEWRTVICPDVAPGDAAGFLTWRDRPDEFRGIGAPPVWNVPYQWGAMALTTLGPVDLRAGWANSAPSSAPPIWGWDADRLDRGSFVAGAAWTASPALRLGASWSRGPYLEPLRAGALPAGAALTDYDQELFGVEVAYSRGPAVVRAELVHDRWEVPNVGYDPVDVSWFVEAQTDVAAGTWVAARYGALHFSEMGYGAGGSRPWDYDVRRTQLSAGHRIVRNAEVRAEWTGNDSSGPLDPSDDLLSLQLWWAF